MLSSVTEVNIDPQYDGVVMLSPDLIYFNDAQPRPDGKKIYHVFEKSREEGFDNIENTILESHEEIDFKQEELFSKASVDNIYNIQQVSFSF